MQMGIIIIVGFSAVIHFAGHQSTVVETYSKVRIYCALVLFQSEPWLHTGLKQVFNYLTTPPISFVLNINLSLLSFLNKTVFTLLVLHLPIWMFSSYSISKVNTPTMNWNNLDISNPLCGMRTEKTIELAGICFCTASSKSRTLVHAPLPHGTNGFSKDSVGSMHFVARFLFGFVGLGAEMIKTKDACQIYATSCW